jgi:uncharacterized protein
MPDTSPPAILGRVVATERKPNTPHEFHFWTALDAPVGIGTIVRVESERPIAGVLPTIYGVVTEGFGYTDLQTPLHDVLGADGVPGASAFAPTERTEIRLYTAAVLRHVPEEPLQPVPMGTVHLATELDVQAALRMDTYVQGPNPRGIPVGMYRAGGTQAAVHLDADFLLGPEAAHLSISGVSGLATKTSAVEWLLSSIFAHFPAEKGGVAAVCFNVKGPDLCFLDQPATSLTDDEREMYAALGVPATPFANVQYFAPWKAKGYQLATLRSNDALQDNVLPLTWGLRETLQYAEVLLNKDDIDAKADALIDFIKERVLDQVFTDDLLGAAHEVRTFGDLDRWFFEVIRAIEQRDKGDTWRTHHIATIRKVRNRLSNISTRCKGLVTDDGTVSDLPFGSFTDRGVYVVDVANLEEDAQDLVFARVVSQLREHLEKRELGVSQVVVFVDELNKYAPADGPDTYVRKMLLDIAERGRYLGLVLFGAQQFRSQVHRRVVGNSGTALYGRMDPDELATPGYQTIAPATKARLASLEKGQLMVRHPHFGQPIFVRFPRPAVLTGREGVERFPPAAELALDAAVTKALRSLDPNITLAWVQDCIALAGDSEDDIIRARNRCIQTRPDDVKAFFRAQLKKRVSAASASQRGPTPLRAGPPDDDPYGG